MNPSATGANSCRPNVALLLEVAQQLAGEGRFQDAEFVYIAAVEADDAGWANNDYGCFLLERDRTPEAARRFRAVLSQSQRNNNPTLRAAAANNLAIAFRRTSCWAAASALQQRALSAEMEIDPAAHSTAATACSLANLANDAILAGDLKLARNLLGRSLELETAAGSRTGQASDRGTLGVVNMIAGRWHEAVIHLWAAYRLHIDLGNDRGAGSDLMNFAELCRRMGRHSAAARFCRRAVRRLRRADSPVLLQRARRLGAQAAQIAQVKRRDPLLN